MTHEANVEGPVRAAHVEIDPAAPVPAPLPEVAGSGLVLAEIAPERAEASAAHLLDFCARWSADGHRVFLCDGCFETPVLHVPAGSANGEGLSDALLYGTSLGRIAVEMDSGVRFASAGTIVADPDAVRDHARWETIVGGFEEAGVLLVVALPADAEEGRLHARARTVIRLGGAADDTASVEADAAGDEAREDEALGDDWGGIDVVDAGDTPEDWRDRDRIQDSTIPIDGALPATDIVVEPAGSKDPARRAGTAGLRTEGEPAPGAQASPRSAPPRPGSSRRSSPLTLLLLVVLLGLVVLGYLGVIEIPYITPTDLDIAG
jgi:hypothetical protein